MASIIVWYSQRVGQQLKMEDVMDMSKWKGEIQNCYRDARQF